MPFQSGSAPMPGRTAPRPAPPPGQPRRSFRRVTAPPVEVTRLKAAWEAIKARYVPPEPEPVFPDTPEFRKAVALQRTADRPGTVHEGETATKFLNRLLAKHKLSHELVQLAARRSR